MTSLDDAQARWGEVRKKGRVRLVVGLVVVLVLLGVISAVAGGSAGIVVGVLVAVVVLGGVVYLVLSKQKTGLGLTPEWAPKDKPRDLDEDDDDEAPAVAAAPAAPAAPAEPVEPLRKVDAQILGEDLVKLGQGVDGKLKSSYALGSLLLQDGKVVWDPTKISASQGAAVLTAAPSEVATVARRPLWGSWALLRVEGTGGWEWCLRIPSSVDLAPAFSELGLELQSA